MKLLLFLSEITIPLLIFCIVGYGLLNRQPVYEEFVEGAKDGFWTVIKMAKSLDMLVIAEGVEEEKQVKMLKRLGCDYIQGYYFAKPMPKKDYVKLLQKSR